MNFILYFFHPLKVFDLHLEYCSALTFGQDVYSNAVHILIACCIRLELERSTIP